MNLGQLVLPVRRVMGDSVPVIQINSSQDNSLNLKRFCLQ